jgi:hypothetical protein
MEILKFLRQMSVRFVGRTRDLFQATIIAVTQRRRQAVLDELEAERLDRIRNPSKYLGKS